MSFLPTLGTSVIIEPKSYIWESDNSLNSTLTESPMLVKVEFIRVDVALGSFIIDFMTPTGRRSCWLKSTRAHVVDAVRSLKSVMDGE